MGYTRLGSSLTQGWANGILDRLELQNRYQHGRGAIDGLALSAGSGLTLNISAGRLVGACPSDLAARTATAPASATSYVWINEGGVVTFTATAADPGGTNVCLGRVIAGASTITSTDTVGRVDLPRMTGLREWRVGRLRVDVATGFLHFDAGTPAALPVVTAPAALTAPATMGASYAQSEVQALRADVAALRSTVAALVAALDSIGLA